MRTNRHQWLSLVVVAGLLLGSAQAATQKKTAHRPAKASSSHSSSQTKGKKSAKKTRRPRGQQAMNPERVREIQAALIREKFLEGQPTGVWDQRSKEAMARYQTSNGWQGKVVPDSRALIKLGLGPDRANLINPETAAFSIVPGGGTARNSVPPTP